MKNYDIIVIGSDINCLVAAALLKINTNNSVVVIEPTHYFGRQTSEYEFFKNFRSNLIYDYIDWLDDSLIKKLNLGKFGLNIVEHELYRVSLNKNMQHLKFYRNFLKTSNSIKPHSVNDSKNWKLFSEHIAKITSLLEPIYKMTPPNLSNITFKDSISILNLLKPLKNHGTRGLVDFIRTIPMMMPELLDEWFESDFLKASLAVSGIKNITQGPFSAATGLNFLHHHINCKGHIHQNIFIDGGTYNLTKSLLNFLNINNVDVIKNTPIESIISSNNTASGIMLTNGKKITSNMIVSGLDPKNTFIDLIGLQKLEPSFQTQLNNIKYRGSVARIFFALKDLPNISGVKTEELSEIFSISPSIEYLEKAYDDAKYGKISSDPAIEFSIPSIRCPHFAPKNQHVLSATVQYAPYKLKNNSWNDSVKDNLIKSVTNILGNYITDFRNIILNTTLLTPKDLEEKIGLHEGSLNHGEMTLDQFLFMRPTISTAQYKTPIKNLYLCGSGTHPGGGAHGRNGINSALQILKR